ncbi:unnamed protein product [marine sediment metagenome]|uniref:YozE SAM-like domain-containing protein n=1 Tax=marine sediment metagenome TaxID=412755 RepID=X0UGX1_9ZZZZ
MEDIENFIKWIRKTEKHHRDYKPELNETWNDCTEEDDCIYLGDLEELYEKYTNIKKS